MEVDLMPAKTATRDGIALTSYWQVSGGVITSGPSLAEDVFTLSISGIPEGSTIQAAYFTATFGSPYSGAAELKVNNITVGYGQQTVPLTPTADGNGNYTLYFRFRAFGRAQDTDGTHGGTVMVSGPTVTVEYTLDEQEEEEEERQETWPPTRPSRSPFSRRTPRILPPTAWPCCCRIPPRFRKRRGANSP